MRRVFTFLFCCLLAASVLDAQVILDEDFEGGTIPSGWTNQSMATDGGWNVGTPASLSSEYWTIPAVDEGTFIAATNDDNCNCDKSADYFVTPSLDFSDYESVVLEMDYYFGGLTYQGATERAFIEYSTDGGATWTQLYELSGNGDGWQKDALFDLSMLAGESSLQLAFRYDDGGGWLYGFAIDNVTIWAPLANDIELTHLAMPRFVPAGQSVMVSGIVTNKGADNLTSFELEWSDGTNTYVDSFVDLDIPTLGTYAFTATMPFTPAEPITYTLSVTATSPNGTVDEYPGDNEASATVSGVSFVPTKRWVAEEATGTWCGWCPRGAVFMDYMAENFPDEFIGIAVHNEDPMAVAVYDNGLTSFPGFPGFPSVIVDRREIIDPQELPDVQPEYAARVAPVDPSIHATLDVATKELSVEASAEFVTQLSDVDYRLNVVLIEDGVTGSGSGYAQANYYAGGGAGPMGGYEDLPDPVPAEQMVYNHVARDILGGWAGFAGSVPSELVAGDVAVHSLTYELSASWAPLHMHAVVMVIDQQTGQILNADQAAFEILCPDDLGTTVEVDDESVPGAEDGAVYVTPSVGFGPYTYEWSTGSTEQSLFDLPAGDYSVTITDRAGCTDTVTATVGLLSSVTDIASLRLMRLSPNPAIDRSTLELRFAKAEDVQIEVLNPMGQLMWRRAVPHTRGGAFPIELAEWPAGIYQVRVSVQDQVRTARLMVAR